MNFLKNEIANTVTKLNDDKLMKLDQNPINIKINNYSTSKKEKKY